MEKNSDGGHRLNETIMGAKPLPLYPWDRCDPYWNLRIGWIPKCEEPSPATPITEKLLSGLSCVLLASQASRNIAAKSRSKSTHSTAKKGGLQVTKQVEFRLPETPQWLLSCCGTNGVFCHVCIIKYYTPLS